MRKFLHNNFHAICAIVVMFFLVFYMSFDSFAETVTPSNESMMDFYNLVEEEIISVNKQNCNTYLHTIEGFEEVSVAGGLPTSREYDFSVLNTLYPIITYLDDGNNSYDFSNCDFVLFTDSNNYYLTYYYPYTASDDNLLTFDCEAYYIRSNVQYYTFQFTYNSSGTYVSKNQWSSPGFNNNRHCYMANYGSPSSYTPILSNMFFTCPTSAVVNGKNYTSQNFNYNNISNYINFNLNYDYIRGGGSQEPDDTDNPLSTLISKNNYANLSAYISGLDNDSLQLHLHFSLPEFIYNYPEYYQVQVVYTLGVDTQSNVFADDYGHTEIIPMRAITGYGHARYTNNSYNDTLDFSELVGNNSTFADDLKSYWVTKSGSSGQYYDDSSVLNFDPVYGVDLQESQGRYLLKSFASDIENLNLKAVIFITDSNNYNSGSYVTTFDLLGGGQDIIQNDIGIKYDPETDEPNFLPITDLGNYFPSQGSSGGTVNNITVNAGSGQNYYKPYNLDEVTVAGVADQWNYMIRTMQDTDSDNSFWAVIKNVYDYIPAPIWGWVWAALASILGCAVFRFYINTIRI